MIDTAEKTVKEQIIEIYNLLDDKSAFLFKLEKIMGRSFNTMKNWWFSKSHGYSIPEADQATVLKEAKKELKLQQNG